MSRQSVDDEYPYRVVRVKDGNKSYFAGHHENGQIHWVDKPDDGVPYPDSGLAGVVQQALVAETNEALNVVRVVH